MAFRQICILLLCPVWLWSGCGEPAAEEPDIVPVGTYEMLEPKAFASRLSKQDTFILLDLRTPTEFARGHLKGARNLNFLASGFVDSLAQLERNIPVFIYSQDGKRSGKAVAAFRKLTFAEVYELQGGYDAMSL